MLSNSRNECDQAFAAAQRAVLEAIALGQPLAQVLHTTVELIEAQSPGMMCSIVLIEDGTRIRHIAAPHLPSEYIQAIDGAQIGPQAGSCGTAAYTHKPVIVEDVATHPAGLTIAISPSHMAYAPAGRHPSPRQMGRCSRPSRFTIVRLGVRLHRSWSG